MRNALAKRTDLVGDSQKQIESNDISIRYLPQPVAARRQRAASTTARIGLGRHAVRASGQAFRRRSSGQTQRGFFGALGDAFAGDFPDLELQLQVNYPIGASNAEANLARARLQNQQAQKQLRAPELQVATQIRDFARNVQTNTKRVEATRAARALAEKRLEAEEKKFQAGMTSSFLVFQAQRDLSQARNNELQAIIDYLKSVVDFETAQEAPLAGGGGGRGADHGGSATAAIQSAPVAQLHGCRNRGRPDRAPFLYDRAALVRSCRFTFGPHGTATSHLT